MSSLLYLSAFGCLTSSLSSSSSPSSSSSSFSSPTSTSPSSSPSTSASSSSSSSLNLVCPRTLFRHCRLLLLPLLLLLLLFLHPFSLPCLHCPTYPPCLSLCLAPFLSASLLPSPFPSGSTYSPFFHSRSSDFMLLPLQAKAQQKQATTAKMDLQNRAICYAMRNPPKGHPRMSFTDLRKIVRKTDGSGCTTKSSGSNSGI